jgi:holo-[acyl-carrier protein] synthase
MNMIDGVGIDLVDVSRMKKLLAKWGSRFTERCYSQNEIQYCQRKAISAIHFAARFAAKEAFLKSLGIGLGMGVKLKEIEVSNDPQGKPVLILHDSAQHLAGVRGVRKAHLSLTHTSECAAAVVILET